MAVRQIVIALRRIDSPHITVPDRLAPGPIPETKATV